MSNNWIEDYGSVRTPLTLHVLKDLSKGRNNTKGLQEGWDSNRQNISRKLNELQDFGLIEEGEFTENGKYYFITDRGESVLASLQQINVNRKKIAAIIEKENGD